jgi:sirohydrochlorin ferrochelatase
VPPVGLLRDDAAPEVRAEAVRAIRDTISALARAAGDSVVVMPLLLSTSKLSQVKVPADLEGLPVRYTRTPLAPLPPLARWIERVAEERRLALSLARTD